MAGRTGALLVVLAVLAGCSSPAALATVVPSEGLMSTPVIASPMPATPVPSVTPAEVLPGTLLRVQVANLHLRSGPSTDSTILASLPAGAIVDATHEANAGADWYEVRWNEVTGYVAAGPDREWLTVVGNGRILLSCDRCGSDGGAAFASVNVDGSDLRPFAKGGGWPAWSPDGRFVALVAGTADVIGQDPIRLMAADGTLQRDLGTGFMPTWSPDGEELAYVSSDQLMLFDVGTTQQPLGLSVSDEGAPASLAWSPDSRQLAFTAVDCPACSPDEMAIDPPMSLFVFEPPGGSVRRVATGANDGVRGWSLDGTLVAYGSFDLSGGGLVLHQVDLATGSVQVVPGADAAAFGIGLSPDGTHVAYGSDAGIVVANRDFSHPVVVLAAAAASGVSARYPSWSPDGQWILVEVVPENGDGVDVELVKADGTGAHALPPGVNAGAEASWQPILSQLP